jgi:hypothetical protein
MSLHLDLKYINLVSPRFESFVKKKDFLFSCRCPICGDSKKNKNKMRGYIYRKDNGLFYKCHNCGAGLSAGNLIRFLDESLYKKYALERYSQGENGSSNFREPTFNFAPVKFDKIEKRSFESAQTINELPNEHYCKQYVLNRKIPESYHKDLFFTSKFKTFVHELNPNLDEKKKNKLYDDARLVIPIYNEYNEIIGLVARALEASNKLRYIKLTFLENQKYFFGQNKVDLSKPILVVEGPIDSMFLYNCLASGDSALTKVADNIDSKNVTLVYDNEPRNLEIVKLMEKAIDKGYSIVIWPDYIVGKDINEMLLNGFNIDLLHNIIHENTCSGLKAKLKFTAWRKV